MGAEVINKIVIQRELKVAGRPASGEKTVAVVELINNGGTYNDAADKVKLQAAIKHALRLYGQNIDEIKVEASLSTSAEKLLDVKGLQLPANISANSLLDGLNDAIVDAYATANPVPSTGFDTAIGGTTIAAGATEFKLSQEKKNEEAGNIVDNLLVAGVIDVAGGSLLGSPVDSMKAEQAISGPHPFGQETVISRAMTAAGLGPLQPLNMISNTAERSEKIAAMDRVFRSVVAIMVENGFPINEVIVVYDTITKERNKLGTNLPPFQIGIALIDNPYAGSPRNDLIAGGSLNSFKGYAPDVDKFKNTPPPTGTADLTIEGTVSRKSATPVDLNALYALRFDNLNQTVVNLDIEIAASRTPLSPYQTKKIGAAIDGFRSYVDALDLNPDQITEQSHVTRQIISAQGPETLVWLSWDSSGGAMSPVDAARTDPGRMQYRIHEMRKAIFDMAQSSDPKSKAIAKLMEISLEKYITQVDLVIVPPQKAVWEKVKALKGDQEIDLMVNSSLVERAYVNKSTRMEMDSVTFHITARLETLMRNSKSAAERHRLRQVMNMIQVVNESAKVYDQDSTGFKGEGVKQFAELQTRVTELRNRKPEQRRKLGERFMGGKEYKRQLDARRKAEITAVASDIEEQMYGIELQMEKVDKLREAMGIISNSYTTIELNPNLSPAEKQAQCIKVVEDNLKAVEDFHKTIEDISAEGQVAQYVMLADAAETNWMDRVDAQEVAQKVKGEKKAKVDRLKGVQRYAEQMAQAWEYSGGRLAA